LLNSAEAKKLIVSIKENIISCKDSIILFNEETLSGNYYQFDSILITNAHIDFWGQKHINENTGKEEGHVFYESSLF
jgi:hypothetical protein